jgi:hypothetical protein
MKEITEEQIKKVAEAVRERRERLGFSQDLSVHGGPKRNAVGAFETRYVWPKLPATRARWARALEWEPDAFDRLLAGEEPVPLQKSGVDPEDLDRAFDALERAISELRRQVHRGSN